MPKDEKSLSERLSNPNISAKERDQILKLIALNNFFGEIILLAYCLMPNHFHFLIKQKSANSIDKFMNSLSTRYTMYFNRKNSRIGPLYQDVYKAVLVESNEQLLHLTRYIHCNPLGHKSFQRDNLQTKLLGQPSSYPDYLEQRKTEWVHSQEILAYFSKTNPKLSYKSFVEQIEDISIIADIAIDL